MDLVFWDGRSNFSIRFALEVTGYEGSSVRVFFVELSGIKNVSRTLVHTNAS